MELQRELNERLKNGNWKLLKYEHAEELNQLDIENA